MKEIKNSNCTNPNIVKCSICADATCCVHPKDTVRDFINTHNTNLNKLSFILSEELYSDYEKSERELIPYDDNGKTIYECDAIDILLTEEQLLDEYVVAGYDDEYVYIKKC